jgi:hypothetical protein
VASLGSSVRFRELAQRPPASDGAPRWIGEVRNSVLEDVRPGPGVVPASWFETGRVSALAGSPPSSAAPTAILVAWGCFDAMGLLSELGPSENGGASRSSGRPLGEVGLAGRASGEAERSAPGASARRWR